MDAETADFDVVAMNPAHYYKGPTDILCDTQLTGEQKVRLLEEWEQDLKRRLESDGEGMVQGVEGSEAMLEGKRANDAALLRQVSNWLRRAREDGLADEYPSAPKTVLGRVWQSIFGKSDKRAAA